MSTSATTLARCLTCTVQNHRFCPQPTVNIAQVTVEGTTVSATTLTVTTEDALTVLTTLTILVAHSLRSSGDGWHTDHGIDHRRLQQSPRGGRLYAGIPAGCAVGWNVVEKNHNFRARKLLGELVAFRREREWRELQGITHIRHSTRIGSFSSCR